MRDAPAMGQDLHELRPARRRSAQDHQAGCEVAYLSPYLKQAKQSAWDYLRRFAGTIPGVSIHESELTIKFPNGARITLYGGDNAESLRGTFFDGIIVDEVADLASNSEQHRQAANLTQQSKLKRRLRSAPSRAASGQRGLGNK
jgi:hypothetical protein